jgi:hypothetical protein
VSGFQKLWAQGQDNQIVGFLYRFRDPLGAQLYFRRTQQSLSDSAPTGASPITVPNIPRAVGYAGSDTDGSASVIAFATGPYLAQIVVNGPPSAPPGTDVATALAQEQYQKLTS